MLDRLATYGIPIVAGVVTALVLIGPGREQAAPGARAYGDLRAGTPSWALRVETLAHFAGRYAPEAREIEVELRAGSERIGAWRGSTDVEGIADAVGPLGRPVGGPLELTVRSRGRTLAHGRIRLGPLLAALPPAGPLDGESHGPLDVGVVLARGITVPAIAEPLAVEVTVPRSAVAPSSGAGVPPRLSVTATGAQVGSPSEPTTRGCAEDGCRFAWSVPIVLQAPAAELTASATTADGRTGSWQGNVPVALGGMWIDPASVARGAIVVRSAVPRQRAYVSLCGTAGRFWGGVVPLEDAGDGQAQGSLPLPSLPSGPLLGVVSGDPFEPELTATGWPLRPELGSLPLIRPALLADGLPAAVQQEQARQARVRRPASALILAAGVLELAYLWRRHRLGRRRLGRLQAAAAETARDGTEPASPGAARIAGVPGIATPVGLWWSIMLPLGVTLAFLALAALTTWG
jgi:hypothetical protein